MPKLLLLFPNTASKGRITTPIPKATGESECTLAPEENLIKGR